MQAPAVDGRGNALVVWAQVPENATTPAVFGRTFTADEGWGDAFQISAEGAHTDVPSVAVNDEGDAIVAWYQWEGS